MFFCFSSRRRHTRCALVTGVQTCALPISCFTYEHRGRDLPPAAQFPSSTVRERFAELSRLSGELLVDEETAGLPATRAPDPGFVHLAHAWAAGDGLASVRSEEHTSELQSLMRISYAVFCLKKKRKQKENNRRAR